MELNEIKKILYKIKPNAELVCVDKEGLKYDSEFKTEYHSVDIIHVRFVIPFEDLGDARFHKSMDAQLLIRWIKRFFVE